MTLTEGFNLLATAPDGIKRLRELILSLAVQGKLVPQDPNDEPASELLKQIRAEKQRLIAEGKIKKDKPLPTIGDDEKLFELPEGWEWVRLGSALKKITDGTHHSPPNVETGDFKYISAKNIKSWGVELAGVTYVTTEIHNEIYSRCDPEFGDILYIKDGATTGIATINPLKEPFSMLSSVALLKPSCGLLNSYLLLGMKSPFFYDAMRAGMSGVAITRVTLNKLNDAIIPLPPLAEQSRIVAKVEELMALCDALEARGQLQAEQHARLTATLFDALAASESAHQLQENWARLAANFDLVLDRPQVVDALEQTILQLAVRGLLVPQDPADEPASELLKQIRAEKDRLIAEGKIKKDKPLPAISDDEKPFDLPLGWEWVRFGSVINSSEAGWSPSCDGAPRTGNSWGVLKVSAVSWGEFRSCENKALPIELAARVEIEVKAGDFLLSRANTEELVARSVVANNPEPKLMMSDKIIRLDLSSLVNRHFFNQVNNAASSRAHYIEHASGTSSSMKNVSREVILNLPVPLPPFAEQSRIVARVEALRALCGQLRQRLAASRDTQGQLASALLAQG